MSADLTGWAAEVADALSEHVPRECWVVDGDDMAADVYDHRHDASLELNRL